MYKKYIYMIKQFLIISKKGKGRGSYINQLKNAGKEKKEN